MIIRVGTRSSPLALAQTNKVISLLQAKNHGVEFEVVTIQTSGDKFLDQNLALIGGKGLFLKEIETAMIDGKIDIAVHSLKDVPAVMPDGLEISTFLPRDDARDAFVSPNYATLHDLPADAKVGTSSPRRVLELQMLRSDIEIVNLRGNINSRIQKVESGLMDACVLAYAGLERLDLQHKARSIFTIEDMIPAVGQGIVCVEHRTSDSKVKTLLQTISDETSTLFAKIERDFMISLNGSCTAPLAAHAHIENQVLKLHTIYHANEQTVVKQFESPVAQSLDIGKLAASDVLQQIT